MFLVLCAIHECFWFFCSQKPQLVWKSMVVSADLMIVSSCNECWLKFCVHMHVLSFVKDFCQVCFSMLLYFLRSCPWWENKTRYNHKCIKAWRFLLYSLTHLIQPHWRTMPLHLSSSGIKCFRHNLLCGFQTLFLLHVHAYVCTGPKFCLLTLWCACAYHRHAMGLMQLCCGTWRITWMVSLDTCEKGSIQ